MNSDKIVKAFNSNELQIQGVISIYGSYFGKPGDTISCVKGISSKENVLIIDIGDRKISIKSPKGIDYNHCSIDINECESIKVNDQEYSFKENEKAFNLYNWSADSN